MLPSRYQVIWETLKASPEKPLKLAAPAAAHARLKKAIKKRKNLDIAHKVLLGEQELVATLVFKSEGALLVVKLEIKTRSLFL